MTQSGGLYLAFITLLLLIALGVAIPVLRDIVIEGIERQRGDATDEPEAAADPSSDPHDGPRVICSNCETPNDPDFTYCRECGTRL